MIAAVVEEVRDGSAVVDVWRRFEMPGAIACALVGARSYVGLYRRLRNCGLEPGFLPAEVAKWAVEGKVTTERVAEIFGVDRANVDASIRRWAARDVRQRFIKATRDVAAEGRFGGPAAQTTEIEMLEEATRLVRDALRILDRVPDVDPDPDDEIDPL